MKIFKDSKKVNLILMGLGSVGALVSLYLWDFHVNSSEIVCFTGCESVLSSEYGEFFGVPIAAYGFGYYIGVLLVIFIRSKIRDLLLDRILGLFIFWGILFSLYLRYLEFFILNDICMWCWISFVVIILMSIVFAFEAKDRFKEIVKIRN